MSRPGDTFNLNSFAIKPPATTAGSGVNQVGILLGVVYNDANKNATRQTGEFGATGVTVYIDANNSGVLDLGDVTTTTNEHGAFAFTNVTPGQKIVRVVTPSPLVQTAPTPGTGRIVTLASSGTISGIQFGIRSTADFDYGDLPLIYGATLLSQDGARHKVGGYYLGAPNSNDVDSELDGKPSAGADGDDTFGVADEDGITFDPIIAGATTHLLVKANQSGYLQGWIDWNNDGDFSDVGERVLKDKGLVAGDNHVFISVPATANVAQVYARFRFGAFGIDSINGAATFGEVEDYRLNVAVPVAAQAIGLAADADADGDVDGFDFLTWQRNLGKTSATQSQGDATIDGQVNGADLTKLKQSFGASTVAAVSTAPPTGDFDSNGFVDGLDFLQWQRGLGIAHPSVGAGDGNHDGKVDGGDMTVFRQQFGQGSASVLASVSASAVASESRGGTISRLSDATLGDAGESMQAEFGGRPFFVASARSPIADLGADSVLVRKLARDAEADSVPAWHTAVNHDRDRAFEDLLGSRRRQGLRSELEPSAGDETDADEAFALFADHFEQPLA